MGQDGLGANFRWLWTGRLVSQVGDRFYAMALAWWILQKTGSGAAMGAYLAAASLPGILAGPWLGPVLDRLPSRRLLVASDLVRALVVGLLTLQGYRHQLDLVQVCVAAGLLSVASAVFDPVAQAVLPRLVDPGLLPRANARLQSGSGLCLVLGPACGAACVAALGFAGTFLLNAASFLFCAGCVARIRLDGAGAGSAPGSYRADLAAGFAFVRRCRDLLRVVAAVGIAHFFTGALALAVPFLAVFLGGGVRTLGMLEMAMGAGFVLGSLLGRGRPGTRMGSAGLWAFLGLAGAGELGLGLLCLRAPGAPLAALAQVAAGLLLALFGGAIVNASIHWQTLIQTRTPQALLARVFSLSSLAGNIAMPMAYLGFGSLLAPARLGALLLGSGACLLLLGGLGARGLGAATPPAEPIAAGPSDNRA